MGEIAQKGRARLGRRGRARSRRWHGWNGVGRRSEMAAHCHEAFGASDRRSRTNGASESANAIQDGGYDRGRGKTYRRGWERGIT